MRKIAKYFRPKAELRDIASPKPSRTAERVLNSAVKRSHADQERMLRKAALLRGN